MRVKAITRPTVPKPPPKPRPQSPIPPFPPGSDPRPAA